MTSLHILQNQPTPRAKQDLRGVHRRPVNAGDQASWLKNPNGLSQGPRWCVTTPGTECRESEGCHNCPTQGQIEWDLLHGIPVFPMGFDRGALSVPFRWKERKNALVSPEGDLFHDNVPDSFIIEVLSVIKRCPQHNFVWTTKRPDRTSMLCELKGFDLPNVYAGVSVESQEYMWRADSLLWLPDSFKKVLFVAPFIFPVDISKDVLGVLDGVICSPERGGSGRDVRACNDDWILELRDQVKGHGIPFFLDTTYTEEVVFRLGRWMELPRGLLD